jgi:hypothetical protein
VSFFFWSLCCLSLDLRILITALVSSCAGVVKNAIKLRYDSLSIESLKKQKSFSLSLDNRNFRLTKQNSVASQRRKENKVISILLLVETSLILSKVIQNLITNLSRRRSFIY